MNHFRPAALTALLAVVVGTSSIGCNSHRYEDERPPVDQLDRRDHNLQSKDVVNSSDQMAMDLLQLPELNASDHAWTVVFTGVKNQTVSAPQNLDIFIQRLRTVVGIQGRGRVQIIANMKEFHDLQSRELEPGGEREDEFGQTGRPTNARPRPGPAGQQPDFALSATAMDLANTGTNYYNFAFTLTDLNRRTIVWTNQYEVRVAR